MEKRQNNNDEWFHEFLDNTILSLEMKDPLKNDVTIKEKNTEITMPAETYKLKAKYIDDSVQLTYLKHASLAERIVRSIMFNVKLSKGYGLMIGAQAYNKDEIKNIESALKDFCSKYKPGATMTNYQISGALSF